MNNEIEEYTLSLTGIPRASVGCWVCLLLVWPVSPMLETGEGCGAAYHILRRTTSAFSPSASRSSGRLHNAEVTQVLAVDTSSCFSCGLLRRYSLEAVADAFLSASPAILSTVIFWYI